MGWGTKMTKMTKQELQAKEDDLENTVEELKYVVNREKQLILQHKIFKLEAELAPIRLAQFESKMNTPRTNSFYSRCGLENCCSDSPRTIYSQVQDDRCG